MSEESLRNAFIQGHISRRVFIVRALQLGISLTSIGTFLAACGATPTEEAVQAPPTESAAQPVPTAAQMEPQNLVIAGSKELMGLDPGQENDFDSSVIYEVIHDTIGLLDLEGNIGPNLAESWDVSEDGLTYTYHFRRGVKFHDGSEMTADDVLYSVDRIMIKFHEGGKYEKINMIDSYEKVDDYTVQVKLQYPYSPFSAAFGIQHVLPKAVIEKIGDDQFNQAPVGCGPFKFVEWVPNDHVALEAFEDYWMVKPKLDTITIRPVPENAVAVANLLAGDVDLIGDVVGSNLPALQGAADKGIEVINTPSGSYFFSGFRVMGPPFTDVRFRQAVYMATDWDAAIETVFPPEIARRAYGSIPPGLWPQDEEYLKSIALKQDREKARALFDELIAEGQMTADYQIKIAPAPDDARISLAEIMVTDLKEMGMNPQLLLLDWAAHDELTMGTENAIYSLGTVPAIPDPDANVRWLFGEGSAHAGYLNLVALPEFPQWAEQLKKAQQSSDQEERTQIYRSIVRTMMEQVIHIPMYHKNAIMAKRDYVKEFVPSPRGGRWDIVEPWVNVYIEGKQS